MEKLWSPWRSQYIDSFKHKDEEDQCVFCEMVNESPEELSNLIVDKGLLTFTVLNLFPYNNGHLMIVPYRHTSAFISLTDDENLEIMHKMRLAYNALKETLHPEGFNMGLNLGKGAGAGIHEHIHFHIVPRWNGDTNFMPVLGEVKVISQDLIETKKKLLEAYKNLKSQ
ncbi:MAG TPA: HIT domain-containing protein [Ignavibacteriaceae bacterium]|nr:HIT domain-containing protein [Ignavibacteriaceae bacterium]